MVSPYSFHLTMQNYTLYFKCGEENKDIRYNPVVRTKKCDKLFDPFMEQCIYYPYYKYIILSSNQPLCTCVSSLKFEYKQDQDISHITLVSQSLTRWVYCVVNIRHIKGDQIAVVHNYKPCIKCCYKGIQSLKLSYTVINPCVY